MDFEIYTKENELRNNYEKITDEHLIIWDSKYTPIDIPGNSPQVLIKGDNKSFVEKKYFNKRFFDMTGGMLSYIDWTNMVVAGGCVSNTINSSCGEKFLSDVDLFIYGLNPEDTLKKITEIINSVKDYSQHNFNSDIHILKNNYVISLIPENQKYRKNKVQIILRSYKCIYEILAGFDIDSCAVAYNGTNVLLTPRSLNAFRTKYNVIDLTRRSPSYESRLYKYHKRGFGIILPFSYKDQNNKLYFVNRYSMGIDKLLYLLQYTKIKKFNKFLNIMTQRINRRLKYKNCVDYESIELTFEKGDIRNYLVDYNKKVDSKFKYKLYNKHSKMSNKIKLITHNPGQQLTGSFNPITKEDWINVDYSPKKIDFLGRHRVLLSIKNNTEINMGEARENDIYDNSLFNALCYMIMYTENEDTLINNWHLKEMFPENKNLYKISYLDLIILVNRPKLFKYILEKEKENNFTTINFKNVLELIFMLDNMDLLLIVHEYHKFNINNFDSMLKKYNCLNIANHYCLKLDKYQQLDTIDYMKPMDRNTRETYLYNLWFNWGYNYNNVDLKNIYKKIDYCTLSINEINSINFLEKSNEPALYIMCIEDIIKTYVVVSEELIYEPKTFNHFWYHTVCNDLILKEKNKDQKRHIFALKLLRELYSKSKEDLTKITHINFENPIKTINPFVLTIMQNVYDKTFENLSGYKNIYRKNKKQYEPLEDLMIKLDDFEIFTKVVKEKDLEEFLKKNREKLQTNLGSYLKQLEKERIDMKKDNIFCKYAQIFKNNSDHQKVYVEGILNKSYLREENVFGFTPCDYVINKVFHFYNSTFLQQKPIKPDMLELLVNLRKSLSNINRTSKITTIQRKECLNPEIETILDILV